jgi:hypothetical protein
LKNFHFTILFIVLQSQVRGFAPSAKIFFFTFGRKLSLDPKNTRKHRYLPILDYPQLTKPNGIGFEKFSFHDTFHRVAKPSPWLHSQRENFCLQTGSAGKTG